MFVSPVISLCSRRYQGGDAGGVRGPAEFLLQLPGLVWYGRVMKLFKVLNVSVERISSLFPPRDPTEEEKVFRAGLPIEMLQKSINCLLGRGYTHHEAKMVVEAVYNAYWYHFGIHDYVHCVELTFWRIRDTIPCIRGAKAYVAEFAGLAPLVYAGVIMGLIAGIYMLTTPTSSLITVSPPCNLYFGTFGASVWPVALVGVSAEQVPFYQVYQNWGPVMTAHARNFPFPPEYVDKIWFHGSVKWRDWAWGVFWVLKLQWVVAHFCGLLTRTGANIYKMREGGHDPWAPPGPMSVPGSEICYAGNFLEWVPKILG